MASRFETEGDPCRLFSALAMTESSDLNHPVLKTPDPAELQSDETQAAMRDRYLSENLAEAPAAEQTEPFDIDRISQGEVGSTGGDVPEPDVSDRQIDVANRSGH